MLEEMPNVTFFFDHKLVGADFRKNRAWFQVMSKDGSEKEKEVSFDLMVGADGAHSAVRYHMMKYTRMNYQQEYIDTLWCEFQIQPEAVTPRSSQRSKFKISPNHLHIWPGRDFMFIAIPSEVCHRSPAFPCSFTNVRPGRHLYVHSFCPGGLL
jgi:kynurenine 3-monooxygenase